MLCYCALNAHYLFKVTIKMNENNGNTISNTELKQLLAHEADIQLIDVRTTDKHQEFNIGGLSIPTVDLPLHIDQLDPNKLTITYCTSGNNSMRALEYLVRAGFINVKSLDGGMTKWKEDII